MHTFTEYFLGDNVKVEALTAPAWSHSVPGRPRGQRANNALLPPIALATDSDASHVRTSCRTGKSLVWLTLFD